MRSVQAKVHRVTGVHNQLNAHLKGVFIPSSLECDCRSDVT